MNTEEVAAFADVAAGLAEQIDALHSTAYAGMSTREELSALERQLRAEFSAAALGRSAGAEQSAAQPKGSSPASEPAPDFEMVEVELEVECPEGVGAGDLLEIDVPGR
jgi:hypothetical protein